jgi:hypothetical protein
MLRNARVVTRECGFRSVALCGFWDAVQGGGKTGLPAAMSRQWMGNVASIRGKGKLAAGNQNANGWPAY